MNSNFDSVVPPNKLWNRNPKDGERDKYLSNIGLMLTKKCNIACRHCVINCISTSDYNWDYNSLKLLYRKLSKMDIVKKIGFTGGEPFLEFEKLKYSINMFNSQMLFSSVVTNGYWATTKNKTREILNQLKGLTKITISADKFHQEFISIQNVRNILKIGNELGLECQIRVSHLNDPIGEIGEIEKKFSDFEGKYELSSQPVQYFGRAATHLDRNQLYRYDAMNLACRTADRILFLPSGEVLACCGPQESVTKGHPLWLGNIQDNSIDDIFERADSNPIIHILRLWGPGSLVKILEDQAKEEKISIIPPTSEQKQEICSLCRYVLDSDEKLRLIKTAIEKQNLTRVVAAARLLQFAETSMMLKVD